MTTPLNAIPEFKILDVCQVPCSDKHQLIFERYNNLAEGGYFVLANSHDPVPLHEKFEALYPGGYTWNYLTEGPDVWKIKITKIRAQQPTDADVPAACTCSH